MPFFDAAIPWHLIRKVRAPCDEEVAISNSCEGSGKAELAGQIWQTLPIRQGNRTDGRHKARAGSSSLQQNHNMRGR